MRKKVSGEDVGGLSLDDNEDHDDDEPTPAPVRKGKPGSEASGLA
jgi:hypothetical protein